MSSSKRTLTARVAALAIVSGTLLLLGSVERKAWWAGNLDETDWLVHGAYFDLYVNGDWSHPAWTDLYVYNQHPPFGAYLYGLALHAAHDPVRSLEPEYFWCKNNLRLTKDFVERLKHMVSLHQLVVGRTLAASLGALAALVLFFWWRAVGDACDGAGRGFLPALALYLLVIATPAFRTTVVFASADAIVILEQALALFFTARLATVGGTRSTLALALVLGCSFSTKIGGLMLVPVLLFQLLLLARPGARAQAFIHFAASFSVGALIAVLLDPSLHESPIARTVLRFHNQMVRIAQQQVVFAAEALNFGQRVDFIGYHLLFASLPGCALLVLLVAGGIVCVHRTRYCVSRRLALLTVGLFCAGVALTFATVPFAWERYLPIYIALLLPLAAVGVHAFRSTAPRRPLAALVLVALVALGIHWGSDPKGHNEHSVTDEEGWASQLYGERYANPDDRGLHEMLLRYFTDHGPEILRDDEREAIERLDARHSSMQ